MSGLIYYFQEYLSHEWSVFRNPKNEAWQTLRNSAKTLTLTDEEQSQEDRKHGRYIRIATIFLRKHFTPLINAHEANERKRASEDAEHVAVVENCEEQEEEEEEEEEEQEEEEEEQEQEEERAGSPEINESQSPVTITFGKASKKKTTNNKRKRKSTKTKRK